MKETKSLVSSKLKDTLKGVQNPHAQRKPLWDGPESDTENGGITFSMLSRFIVCRERFRVQYLDGWCPNPQFNPRMEFGNMWHVCEEALSGRDKDGHSTDGKVISRGGEGNWLTQLTAYTRELHQKYPFDADRINNWYGICKVQFPIYVEYWSTTKFDQNSRKVTPLLQEQVFNVPYKLPSGRTVRLRGKWDEVVLVEDKTNKLNTGIWVGDHKTKSQIDGLAISRQLTNDLQSCLYQVALGLYDNDETWQRVREVCPGQGRKPPVKGMRYNVIKRPGQYQGKKETPSQFFDRLGGIVREKPGEFFARWETLFSPENLARFRQRTLDPLLEGLCNWYRFITDLPSKPEWELLGLHWMMPFGVYNPLTEGGATDLDAFITKGSTVGLERTTELFTELK